MPTLISCVGLRKNFRGAAGTARAVDDVSFSLDAGGIVGLFGPDGAGKTTLIRMICGLLRPTAGTLRVLGADAEREPEKIQAHIGYVPQKFGLYEDLSVSENLALYAGLHDVRGENFSRRSRRLLELTRLEKFGDRPAGKLSGGMKQKLAIACALIAEPKLLVLDEPTVGVDVLSRREIWNILRDLVSAGKTSVFASTAYMDEADFCDRTLTLFEGRLLADKTPAEMRALARERVSEPTFEDGFMTLIAGEALPPPTRKIPLAENAPVAVRAENVVKKFGNFTAVNDVSFTVRRGEIFGLLGANGAGKTTMFRMLCGLSETSGGRVSVAGTDLRAGAGAARRKLGYMAQKFSLYGDVSLEENLRFFGGAYGLSGKKLRERIAWALSAFRLSAFGKTSADALPLGVKQRLSMACALLHEPEVLFLDEATSGADPLTRREFWTRIMEVADLGAAVVITTHFLDEARWCDRMIVMESGSVAAAGTAEEICALGESPRLEEAFIRLIRKRRENE